MKDWNSLSKQEQIRLELKAQLDPIFFCQNEYFLGIKLYDKPEETSQLEIFREFYRRTPDGGSIYNELVMPIGMRAGKTFFSSLIDCYEAFGLLLYQDPALHFELAPGSEIFLINAATNDEQAKDTIFAQVKAKIDNSPWFQAQTYKERTNEFKFEEKRVIIRSGGSNSDALVGKTAKLVLFDELDRFLNTSGRRSGDMVYSSLGKSVGSFGHEGKRVSISSALATNGMILTLGRRYAEIPPDGILEYGVYKKAPKLVVYLPTWEFNPKRTYNILWDEYGKYDSSSFWRDFGCKPVAGSDLLYKDPDAIIFTKTPNLAYHFCDNPDDARVFHWDYEPPAGIDYKLIGDPAQKEDAYPFAVVHRELDRPIVDALFRLVPDSKHGIALQPSAVKEITLNLCDMFRISEFVIDQDRYPETTEEVVKKGVEVILHNVDWDAHNRLKARILTQTIDIPDFPTLSKELKGLKEDKAGKKVDHVDRVNEGKDVADVVANGNWLLMDSKDIKKGKPKQLTFVSTIKNWGL